MSASFNHNPFFFFYRGEKASRANSFRKNAFRQVGTTKLPALKLDAALVTRDSWRVELLAMESGFADSLDGQSKFLSDKQKLASELKDQMDFIYAKLPSRQKSRIAEVEVFGILTSGRYFSACDVNMVGAF